MLTIFFSNIGLKELDNEALSKLVQDERLATFADNGAKRLSAATWANADGYEFWSVGIAVGADDEIFISDSIPIFPYSKSREPNTIFIKHPLRQRISREKNN